MEIRAVVRMRNTILILVIVGLSVLGCQKGPTAAPVWTIEVPETLRGPELVYGDGLPPGEPAAGDQKGNLRPPGEAWEDGL